MILLQFVLMTKQKFQIFLINLNPYKIQKETVQINVILLQKYFIQKNFYV